MYGKEQTEQEAKIAAMREDDSKDDYDVRKQEEVLAETVAMIPDTRGRLERGHEDLEELLVRRRPATPRHATTASCYITYIRSRGTLSRRCRRRRPRRMWWRWATPRR